MDEMITTGDVVFSVKNMEKKIGEYLPYLPQGETLIASVRAISNGRATKVAYKNCAVLDDEGVIVPCAPEQGGYDMIYLSKEKHSLCDIYIGITENCFIVADALQERYAYFFGDRNFAEPETLTEPIRYGDIGKVFRFEDIESIKIKKGFLGVTKVNITMKNQGYFRLQFPKRAGVFKQMPNHLENQEKVLSKFASIAKPVPPKSDTVR